MSFTYGFYNGNDRKYNSVQISEMFDGLIKDGVYATIGTSLIVRKSSEANKVIVGVGRAWFNHTWSYNDSDMLLSGPESDLFLNRWDAVVLDIHSADESRTNSILWVTGSAGTTPTKPAMIKEPGHYQYPLAYIYRKTNTSTINQEDITNMVGTSDTPFVTGILDTLDIDNLLLQWNDQWTQFVLNYEQTATEWTALQKTAFQNYVEEFEGEMNAWLEEMQDALGTTPATNLQNQITELKTKIGTGDLATSLGESDLVSAVNKIWSNDQHLKFYNPGRISNLTGSSYEKLLEAFKYVCEKIKAENKSPDSTYTVFCRFSTGDHNYNAIINTRHENEGAYSIAFGLIYSYAEILAPIGTYPIYLQYDYSTTEITIASYPINALNNDVKATKKLTQAQFNALTTKDPDTLYLIVG